MNTEAQKQESQHKNQGGIICCQVCSKKMGNATACYRKYGIIPIGLFLCRSCEIKLLEVKNGFNE